MSPSARAISSSSPRRAARLAGDAGPRSGSVRTTCCEWAITSSPWSDARGAHHAARVDAASSKASISAAPSASCPARRPARPRRPARKDWGHAARRARSPRSISTTGTGARARCGRRAPRGSAIHHQIAPHHRVVRQKGDRCRGARRGLWRRRHGLGTLHPVRLTVNRRAGAGARCVGRGSADHGDQHVERDGDCGRGTPWNRRQQEPKDTFSFSPAPTAAPSFESDMEPHDRGLQHGTRRRGERTIP